MYSKTFDFDLEQKVKIIEIDRPGIVTGLLFEGSGTQYRVQYWDNACRKTEWLYAFELERLEKQQ